MMANIMLKLSTPVLQKTHSFICLQQKYFKTTNSKQTPSKIIIEDILDVKYKQYRHILDKESTMFLDNMSETMQDEKLELESMIQTLKVQNEESKIPENLSSLNWKILLTLMDTEKKRMKYLQKLWEKEQNLIEKAAVMEKIINDDSYICDDSTNPISRASSMVRYSNKWKGVQSLLYGRPVIIDMDYRLDDFEGGITVAQIIRMYKKNCMHMLPCHLHFTSTSNSSHMLKFMNTAAGKHIAADFHDDHFLDLFPNKRLLYLTPEGEMYPTEDIDNDTIFILGGTGSAGISKRSHVKAKMMQIPQCSFPLRKFISFNERTRNDLHLDVALNILLDKFNGKTWKQAFDNCLPDSMFVKHPQLVGELPDKKRRKLDRRHQRQTFTVDRTLEILKSMKGS